MKNKHVEQQVSKSFSQVKPDVYNSVASDCPTRKSATATRPKQQGWKWATCAMALVLVLALVSMGLILGLGGNTPSAVAATVTLDVNPSIEIQIDNKQNVVDVKSLNADGDRILGTMANDLKGDSLETAVNAVLGSMMRNGYFNASNSVLVSVDAPQNTYQELVNKVTTEIKTTLGGVNIEASVLAQWITETDTAKDMAQRLNISLGKAQLITRILAYAPEDSTYTEEQLAALTVNELNLILENLNIPSDVLSQSGSASQSKYIGKDEAMRIALAELGLTQQDVRYINCKMDNEDGFMVYEVGFAANGFEYEFDINAINGRVLKSESEREHHIPNPSLGEKTEAEIREIIYDHLNVPQEERGWIQIGYDPEDKTYFAKFNYNGFYYDIELNIYGEIIDEEKQVLPEGGDGNWTVDGGNGGAESVRATLDAIKTQVLDLLKVPAEDRANLYVKAEYDRDDLEFEAEVTYNNVEYEFKFDSYGNLISRKEKAVQQHSDSQQSPTDDDAWIDDMFLQLSNVFGETMDKSGIVNGTWEQEIETEHGRTTIEVEFKWRNSRGVIYEVECELDYNTHTLLDFSRERD